MGRGFTLAIVGVTATLAVPSVAGPNAPSGEFRKFGVVTRVVDGDTLDVRGSGWRTRVRVLGIDTPERGECYFTQASSRARTLTLGKRVSLVGDRTQATRDRFGRLLAYVGVPGGADLGRSLIGGGFGRVYVFDKPFIRVSSYRGAQRSAKSRRAGLWGRCLGRSANPPPGPVSPGPVSPGPPTPPTPPAPPIPPTPPPPPSPPAPPPPTPPPSPPPSPPPPPAPPPPPPPPHCADALDNDGDGLIDYPADTGCADATDTSERTPLYSCDNGFDNDSDGKIDYPADPGCSSPTDTSELDAGCHASYPDFCILPPPPDKDCADVAPRTNFTVRHDVPDPDPHGFDGNQNGIGCET